MASSGPVEGVRRMIGLLMVMRPGLNDWAVGNEPVIRVLRRMRVARLASRTMGDQASRANQDIMPAPPGA